MLIGLQLVAVVQQCPPLDDADLLHVRIGGGTVYNESTGATHPVEGFVDEQTQRAAWKAVDGTNANVVMETGVFNLTQDQAPVLVHFGPDQTQTALLVRLDEAERP